VRELQPFHSSSLPSVTRLFALLRVASTGAIEESREVALAYARNARACLNGELHREELESLTYAVVNREH